MGMSASQARYLALTARKSNIEFQGQQINQRRSELAKQMEAISQLYTNKLSNRQLLFVQTSGNELATSNTRLSYDIITGSDGLNMRIVDKDGNIVTPFQPDTYEEKIKKAEADYQAKYNRQIFESQAEGGGRMIFSGKNFCSSYFSEKNNTVIMDKNNILVNNDEFMEQIKNMDAVEFHNFWTEGGYQYQGELAFPESKRYDAYDDYLAIEYQRKLSQIEEEKNDKYLYDIECVDPLYLEKKLRSGEWLLEKLNPDNLIGSMWTKTSWQGNQNISDVLDKEDDTQAETEYQNDSRRIQQQDKILELTQKQLDTEHSAIQTEIDSVKQVISKNIETTFKTFG